VGISAWHVTGAFVWAVLGAVAIGVAVGKLNLLVRSKITDTNAGVALSLVVPFVAYIPAERLGASGLVAAVTAGVITGYGAPRMIGARDRITERTVWRTIELLLESSVFLLIGLELPALVKDLTDTGGSVGSALRIGALAATLAFGVRTIFVAWSVWVLARRNRRSPAVREKLTEMQDQVDQGQIPELSSSPRKAGVLAQARSWRKSPSSTQIRRIQQTLNMRIADLDYLAAEQFTWRDGVMLVWAGMRGAVTVAAAQTLPVDTPSRSLLVLVATFVAVGTLVIQGSTLSWLAKRLGLNGLDAEESESQWTSLQNELSRAALARLDAYPEKIADTVRERLTRRTQSEDDPYGNAMQRVRLQQYLSLRLDLISAERDELLSVRRTGSYSSAMLDAALSQLDAEQIGIELRR
jgi:CPA1 family monovalent cation:H+ antiporter